MHVPNVIVFGETGVGKSSVINMLAGAPVATASNSVQGVTFQSAAYEIKIGDGQFKIYDTIGLGEDSAGSVPATTAVKNIYQLMVEVEGGVDLLVYVLRGPRLGAAARKNYQMFYEILCQKKVPIVIIITGLEAEHDRNAWWSTNKAYFDKRGMEFVAAACITASPGKGGVYQKEYEESQKAVQDLILRWSSRGPWHPPTTTGWFTTACIDMITQLFPSATFGFSKSVKEALVCAGMSVKDATVEANKIERQIRRQLRERQRAKRLSLG